MTTLDDILSKFKLHDTYFFIFLTLISITNLSNSIYSENYIFTADDVGYRCRDERYANNTCSSLSNSTDVCSEWVYDNPRSFVAYFQLACQGWKRTLVGTTHNFGYMVGLLVVGPLSDRFGRKTLLVATAFLGAVLGVARSFSTAYWTFVTLEFLEGAFGDPSSPAFTLIMEMMAKEKRVAAYMISSIGYAVGAILLAVAASCIPDWRIFLRVSYIPAFLFATYIYALDESPRWLLSKGRKSEAVDILIKAAVRSHVSIEENSFNIISSGDQSGLTMADLLKATFKSRKLLKRFFICITWWTVSIFVNFGMNINSVYLQGNKYFNFAITSAVTIPVYIVIIFILNRSKRKTALFWSFISAGIFLLIQPFIPSNMPWLSIILFVVGKVISSMYFEIIYIFTSEIFPTHTRNSMHALCSSIGRIGSILAPQTPLLMVYWHGLPSVLFGAASLAAGVVTLFAPATAHAELPDTVRQAEALGRKKPAAPELTDHGAKDNTK